MRVRTFALAVLVSLLWPGGSATADEGPGTFGLERTQPVADNQIRYVVRLTYLGDGHPARDATVTATLVAADGSTQTPVSLERADDDGRYSVIATFPSPGEWKVRFTAVKPPATLEQPASIAAPTTTSTATTTTTTASDGDAGESPASGDPPSGGGGRGPLLVLLGVVAVIGGGAASLVRRHRRT